MSEFQKFTGVDRDYDVIYEPWEWEEKEADYQWFDELVKSGDYEDGPLLRVPNLDEWDGEDMQFEMCIEFTRNPINLFSQYLIKKYGFEKGAFFLGIFWREIGLVDSSEGAVNIN